MKFSLSIIFAIFAVCSIHPTFAQKPVAPEAPKAAEPIDPQTELKVLRRLFNALLQYEELHKKFPPTLAHLVSEKIVKAEEIFIKRSDGSLQSPIYYPGHTSAESPDTVLLAFDLDRLPKRAVLKLLGSVQYADIKIGEQDASGNRR